MKKNRSLVLFLIVFLAAFIRFYQLGTLPSILNRDEAALAYNGFLLKEQGVDEFNRGWPLVLESFGDFKLPGYPWFLAVLFSVLPTNDVVVRLPSALAGVGLVVVVFSMSREFFLSGEARNSRKQWYSPYLVALLVAVVPVFWFYSRIAFEANLGLLLFSLSLNLLFWFKAADTTRKTNTRDLAGLLLMLLAVYTYNTPFLLLPFVIPVVIVARGVKNYKNWLLPMSGLVIVFLVAFNTFAPLTSQKSGITIFSDETFWHNSVEYRQSLSGLARSILGNRFSIYFGHIFNKIWQSFSPAFLVTRGGSHPWHSVPGWGHMFWSSYLFAMLGLIVALAKVFSVGLKTFLMLPTKNVLTFISKQFQQVRKELLLLYALFASLAPSVITVDAPHATRSLFFFVMLMIVAVYGLQELISKLAKTNKLLTAKAAVTTFVLILLIEFIAYAGFYFFQYPDLEPASLKQGFQQVMQQAEQKYQDKKIAIVDDEGFQYILTAWYGQIPAEEFLTTVVKQQPDRIGFRYGQQVANYHFIGHPEDKTQETVMIMWEEGTWKIQEF